MKQLNEVEHLKNQLSEEDRQSTLDHMLIKQLEGFEKMMESNGAYIRCPVAYNLCAGFIDQLKYYAPAAFRPAENLLILEKKDTDPIPLYGNQ
jgi:succinate dehydrogenase/fumarate reductase-like Fe-S protein